MQLMDPYTYGSLILDTYIKVPLGIKSKRKLQHIFV
jgi:hypothetical protein